MKFLRKVVFHNDISKVKWQVKNMRGIGLMGGTDFSSFQFEITIIFLFILFCIMSFWVLYDSDNHFEGIKRLLLWLLTLITGPIGLGFYLFMRRRADF
jgi:hypothetical protein